MLKYLKTLKKNFFFSKHENKDTLELHFDLAFQNRFYMNLFIYFTLN